jgi:hypothetical protein
MITEVDRESTAFDIPCAICGATAMHVSIRAQAVRRWFVRATEATMTEVPKQETDP